MIIEKIIENLIDSETSLVDALLKTKVLLRRIERPELEKWINFELEGYPPNYDLPAYRMAKANVVGNVANTVTTMTNHPLPVMHLDPNIRDIYENLRMPISVSALERLSRDDEDGLSRAIPLEFNSLFNEALSNGFQVQTARAELGDGQVQDILVKIRSRLLGFVLDLEKYAKSQKYENINSALKSEPRVISMFNGAMFGDNAQVVIGDNNRQAINIEVVTNDVESLVKFFQDQGITDNDVEKLKNAIDADAGSAEVAAKSIGPTVSDWINDMLHKSLDTVWQVEIGIASSLLSTAILKYYGW